MSTAARPTWLRELIRKPYFWGVVAIFALLLLNVLKDPNYLALSVNPTNGNLVGNLNSYNPGGSSQVPGQNSIVLVRVLYTWQLNTPMFANYFANMSGNMRLITSTMAFKNEPY